MSALLEVRGLEVSYGHVRAVRGLDLEVNAGELLTLIGPNGAGKSTTLHALAGLLKPQAGSIRFEGKELAGRPSHEVFAAGVVLVPEGRGVLQTLSVEENLLLGAESRPWLGPKGPQARKAAIEAQLERFPVLRKRFLQPAGALSGGEQQMLAVARGLLARPRLLLLDEPSMGLAPQLVKQVFAALQEIPAAETTLLLVEQNARLALKTAKRACVLERGEIVLRGEAAALAEDPRVQAAYLGG
jgi:branched-chain amino acid transport system ATP-binding protein